MRVRTELAEYEVDTDAKRVRFYEARNVGDPAADRHRAYLESKGLTIGGIMRCMALRMDQDGWCDYERELVPIAVGNQLRLAWPDRSSSLSTPIVEVID